MTIFRIISIAVFLFSAAVSVAQDTMPADTSKADQVLVDHADIGEYIQEGDRQIQMLMKEERQVELRQGDVFMYCDTAIIEENDVVAYGDVIIQQGDSLNVFADSLIYLGDQRIADLFGGVILETDSQRLFTEELNYDLNLKLATYYSGAMLTNGQTQLTSKRGFYFVDDKEVFFKDSVFVVDESFNLQADTLSFNTDTRVATFLGPTIIRQDSAIIYCEAGFYDTANKQAEFTQNAQYKKGTQQATADVILYDGAKDEVILEGEAKFVDEDKIASADLIRYDQAKDMTFLEGNAIYQDENQFLESDLIRYDSKNESFQTEGRSRIVDESQILMADTIDYSSEAEEGLATGNVIWIDTIEQVAIYCEKAEYNKATDYLKASGGRPMMSRVFEEDTLFLAADTLISYKPVIAQDSTDKAFPDNIQRDSLHLPLPDSVQSDSLHQIAVVDTVNLNKDSTALNSLLTEDEDSIAENDGRNLLAFNNVKVYKSDLQAVCDSLTYNTQDSLFRFFRDPVIWSDTSQFSADTIHMQLANDQIDRIHLYQNSFILNSEDELFFNQIKGRNITAFFEENELRRVGVNGNAESLYYALDDKKAYVAVNKTICSEMLLYFGNNQIDQIKFFRQPEAEMFPMGSAKHSSLQLKGFNWQIGRRPMSVADLRAFPTQELGLVE